MEFAIPQNIAVDTVTATWKTALASYRKSILKDDFQEIQQSTGPQDILNYIESVKRDGQARNVSKTFSAIKACMDRLHRFGGALDILAQGFSQPGCLLWGSIKFALTIVHGNIEELEKLLRALVLIGDCLPRVELYTKTFLNSLDVQNHVHSLYVAILNFWARAIKFNKRRKLWKFVRSAWFDYDSEFQNLEVEMQRHRDGVEKAAIAQHISDDSENRTEQKQFNQSLVSASTRKQHKEIVRWLAPKEYEAEYYKEDLEHARKLRHAGTCVWICANAEFMRWSASTAPSPESLLWIHAIPGAGKTVLSSFLVDHYSAPLPFQPSNPVFYFLFKNTDTDKNSVTAAARSLLYQLYKMCSSTNTALVGDIEQHITNSGQIKAKNFSTLWNLFSKYSTRISGLAIIIDALDECIEPKFLIRGLQRLSQENAIKIIVTSRREKELVDDLQSWSSMGMGVNEVGADIKAFLEYKVSKSPRLSHPLVRSSIIRLLQSRSKGMFLWVTLMIKELKSKVSIYEIQDALTALPDGLDKVYERILKRLHTSLKPSPKVLCLKVLRWVVCATRPLKMNELEEALKMDYTGEAQLFGFDQAFLFTERDIELACGSLLTVRSGTVQLVHLSAKDFLQKSALNTPIDGDLQEFLVDVPIASLQIASQCASYLFRLEPESFLPEDRRSWSRDVEALRLSLPFVDYACFNWLVHLANSTKSSMTEQEEEVLQSFFQSQTCLIWIELMFNLDQDCLFFLRLNTQALLDWATMQIDSLNLLTDTQSNIIRAVKLWATSLLQLLSEYGTIFKLRPSEIYFIDPEMFESLRFSTSDLEMPYERHVILNDPLTPNQQRSLPENQHFQYTGTADQVGCLYFDRFRNVFLIIDGGQQLGAPLIFCQERSTGRRLAPLSDPELESEEENISVAGTIMSADGKHLAVVFTWFSNNSSEPTMHTTVWAVPKKLNFDTGQRTSPWAKKLFSSTVNTEIFEGSVRPLVFGADGSLSCPSGLVTFSTGEIQALNSDLLESPVTQLSYSGDGESLVCLSNEDEIVIYTIGGQIVSSFATDGECPSLLSFSCRGESVIYTSFSSSEKRHIPTLLDISTGTAQQFEIPAGLHYNSESLIFDDDRQILGIFPYQDTPENTITRLLIWTGLPSKLHLWATKELPTNILGHFLDERSLELYIIHPGRIWSRINLRSPKLLSVETYTARDIDTDPVRVEYCVAKNGTKLGIVRLWKLKASVQILDINCPGETFLSSFIDPINCEIRTVKIAFSPSLELLLVGNIIYHIDFDQGTMASTPLPIPIPSLINDQLDSPPVNCVFSSCNTYLAIAVDPSDYRGSLAAFYIFHIAGMTKVISNIEIPNLQLKDCAGLKIDFHPTKPDLAIGCWTNQQNEDGNERLSRVRCYSINLQTMILEPVRVYSQIQESEFVMSELESTLKFSDCGQYLTLFNHLFCYFFSLQSDNEVPRSFSRPSIIRSGSHGSWNHCFFKLDDGAVGWDFLRTSMYHYVQDENETLTWTTERKNLTPLPAHLVKAKATLLLGSDEYPNLRILFYQGNHPPEIKYLNITWEEFESEFDLGSSPFSRPSIPSLEDSQEPD